MSWKQKRRAPDKPTRKAAMAAFNAFAPLDHEAKKIERKKRSTITDDNLDGVFDLDQPKK